MQFRGPLAICPNQSQFWIVPHSYTIFRITSWWKHHTFVPWSTSASFSPSSKTKFSFGFCTLLTTFTNNVFSVPSGFTALWRLEKTKKYYQKCFPKVQECLTMKKTFSSVEPRLTLAHLFIPSHGSRQITAWISLTLQKKRFLGSQISSKFNPMNQPKQLKLHLYLEKPGHMNRLQVFQEWQICC